VLLLQGHEVAGLIVGSPFDPAAVEDAGARKKSMGVCRRARWASSR
jgi:hypothetical protein